MNTKGRPAGGADGGTMSAEGASLEAYPMSDRPGVRVIGEMSALTRAAWHTVLEELVRQPGDACHADLSQVTFVDVAGITDLALTAQALTSGRRIVLHDPPPQLPRILELFWPGLSEIEVAS
ncbi:STAS domain-containing protein [Streptomyces sp. NPDC093595]|uniref:STAS domain-containing protein n=1 Tax=Streptomyces sp. NPDC093595 TaxID=3366045 RepID=UPI00380F76CD